jgi:hypothetical protein
VFANSRSPRGRNVSAQITVSPTQSLYADNTCSDDSHSLFDPAGSPLSLTTTVTGSSPETNCQMHFPDSQPSVMVPSLQRSASSDCRYVQTIGLGISNTIPGAAEIIRENDAFRTAPGCTMSRASSLGVDDMDWPLPPTRRIVVDTRLRQAWQEVTPSPEVSVAILADWLFANSPHRLTVSFSTSLLQLCLVRVASTFKFAPRPARFRLWRGVHPHSLHSLVQGGAGIPRVPDRKFWTRSKWPV